MQKEKKTLETAFEELSEVVKQLEQPGVSLNEAFLLYNEGMKLVKYCNASIDKVEKKLIVLEEGDENEFSGDT